METNEIDGFGANHTADHTELNCFIRPPMDVMLATCTVHHESFTVITTSQM